MTAPDPATEQAVNVGRVLLPRLGLETRKLVDGFDGLETGSAIHAVSRLIFNEMRARASISVTVNKDGAVIHSPGHCVLSTAALEMEIARTAGFVHRGMSSSQTAAALERARPLREFVFQAARECPGLFEHLRQQAPKAPDQPMTLFLINVKERIIDSAERWRP